MKIEAKSLEAPSIESIPDELIKATLVYCSSSELKQVKGVNRRITEIVREIECDRLIQVVVNRGFSVHRIEGYSAVNKPDWQETLYHRLFAQLSNLTQKKQVAVVVKGTFSSFRHPVPTGEFINQLIGHPECPAAVKISVVAQTAPGKVWSAIYGEIHFERKAISGEGSDSRLPNKAVLYKCASKRSINSMISGTEQKFVLNERVVVSKKIPGYRHPRLVYGWVVQGPQKSRNHDEIYCVAMGYDHIRGFYSTEWVNTKLIGKIIN